MKGSKSILCIIIYVLAHLVTAAQASNNNDMIKVSTARNYGKGFTIEDIISSFYLDSATIDKKFIPADVISYVFKAVHFNYVQYYYYLASTYKKKIDSSRFRWYMDYEHYDSSLLTKNKINEDILWQI